MDDTEQLAADIFARRVSNDLNAFSGSDWKDKARRSALLCKHAAEIFYKEL